MTTFTNKQIYTQVYFEYIQVHVDLTRPGFDVPNNGSYDICIQTQSKLNSNQGPHYSLVNMNGIE